MSEQMVNLLIGLGAGGFAALVAGLLARRKNEADTADVITQAAERVLKQVQARSEQMERELSDLRVQSAATRDKLERDVSALSSAVHRLSAMIVSLGGDPSEIIDALDMSRRDSFTRSRQGDQIDGTR